ncbi:uncharacterized protein TrAtP1_004423 [Trichoderma atroviride]|uniref:uncharacterized protein n=1 Tax=Hypocrea atroviridis TaxID=63577 RepID=UPI00331984B3|nr:hypothetical protein TrAtP1_004423 [Trichoderma atroviride]
MQRYLAQTPQQDAGTYARLVQVVGRPFKDKQCSSVDCILAQENNLQLDTPSTEAISPHFSTGYFSIGSSTLSWAYHASFGHFELQVHTYAAHVDGSYLKLSEARYTNQSWQICSVDLFGAAALEQWLHHISTPLEQFVTPCDAQASLKQQEEEQEQEYSTISESSSSSSSPPSEEVFSLKSSSNTDTNSASILEEEEEAVLHNATAEEASGSDLVDEFARFTLSWLAAWSANRRDDMSSNRHDPEAHAHEGQSSSRSKCGNGQQRTGEDSNHGRNTK